MCGLGTPSASTGGRIPRPDVAGWLRERLAEPPEDDDAVVAVRPDWVCEIISPRKAAHDLEQKMLLDQSFGD